MSSQPCAEPVLLRSSGWHLSRPYLAFKQMFQIQDRLASPLLFTPTEGPMRSQHLLLLSASLAPSTFQQVSDPGGPSTFAVQLGLWLSSFLLPRGQSASVAASPFGS